MHQVIIKNASLSLLVGAMLLPLMQAHANQIDEQIQDDRRRQADQPFEIPKPAEPELPIDVPQAQAITVDKKMLLSQPELLARAMLSALVYHQTDGVEALLPIYEAQPQALIEVPMLTWAKATIATKHQDHRTAVALYQELLEDYPNNQLFKARLAQSLFAHRQYKEAHDLIKDDPVLSEQMTPYVRAIEKLAKTNIRIGGNIIADKNINNAPRQRDLGGGWTASEPISAHGLATHASISKRFLFEQGVSVTPELGIRSKLYRDAKQYNEVTARSSLGVGMRDDKGGLSIAPFHEITYYAGANRDNHKLAHFSDSLGVRVGADIKTTNDGQLSTQVEISKNRHQTRKHLDGHSVSISPSFSKRYDALGGAWLSVGADFNYVKTQDKDDSYRRYGLSGSIAKQWQDFGVSANASYAKRRYLAPMPIFGKTQVNDEYSAGLSLWHDKLSYKGFMPRLTWQYQKTDSSIPLYRYDKNRVFVELMGSF
ncbi:MAG: porin family protein [Moraxella sp.]|nr:porin family protein [Moraxella sp.]